MSVREITPLFSWGFSLRRSRWLLPLFNNNIWSFGNAAVNTPYGWSQNKKTGRREKSTNFSQQQIRETHSQVRANSPDNIDAQIMHLDLPTKPSETIKEVTSQTFYEAPCEAIKKIDSGISSEVLSEMSDGEIIDLMANGKLMHYELEKKLGIENSDRAVRLRRMHFAANTSLSAEAIEQLPHEHYDFSQVTGVCCENVLGYVPIPVGVAGPLLLDGKQYMVPMATVEGALVASTTRGFKALRQAKSGEGVQSILLNDGMTRGPAVQMPNAKRAGALKKWLEDPQNFSKVAAAFNSTSRFARLQEIKVGVAGRKVFLRFKCKTGDAMGMNMISKATDKALKLLMTEFHDMELVSLSGNYCTDKKPSSINWIEGRGKSVVCDAIIPESVVKSVLKTSVDKLVHLNVQKNLVGSAMAGSIGGFNAHASNMVTAVFLATGQDAAQNVESSNCMTIMEKTPEGDLYMSVTMPSIEVGTIGGGTHLKAQRACLSMLGIAGTLEDNPGHNAQQLAKIVAATVMAGELSLMSALAEDTLVGDHMKHNRAKK
jgi:hydroxymethylglutaryl-CoA reductase (NADPH)